MNDKTQSFLSDTQFPWLVFKLLGNLYAVNSRVVSSIILLPEQIESLPEAPDGICGIFTLRGEVVPLLDLRHVLGMQTMQEEQLSFIEMLETRKQDHLFWADELERSIRDNTPFTLATNPHQCALGKWYDHYVSELGTVNHHLKKIKEPHDALHRSALDVLACSQNHALCKRKTCLKNVMHKVQEELVPQIEALLDEAKTVFTESVRQMVIVLDDGRRQIGVMVDEVSAVCPLTPLEEQAELEHFGSMEYIVGICHSEDTSSLILLLDPDRILGILS